jgi:hypothetical protein
VPFNHGAGDGAIAVQWPEPIAGLEGPLRLGSRSPTRGVQVILVGRVAGRDETGGERLPGARRLAVISKNKFGTSLWRFSQLMPINGA